MASISSLLRCAGGDLARAKQTLTQSWSTFKPHFEDWLSHVSRLSTKNVRDTLKFSRLLWNAEDFVNSRSNIRLDFVKTRLGGTAVTLDRDLREVYTHALKYYEKNGDIMGGKGWEHKHPISKLSHFKKYLEGKGFTFAHPYKNHLGGRKRKQGCDAAPSRRKKKRRTAPKKLSKKKLHKEEMHMSAFVERLLTEQCTDDFEGRRDIVASVRRTGQTNFRNRLLWEFDDTCPATGVNDATFLDAAHLVPWRTVKNCAYDNGVPLYLSVHRAMDRGYITYDECGQLWRRPDVDIAHLHIRHARLPAKALTKERRRWLGEAHTLWLETHGVEEREMIEVVGSSDDSSDESSDDSSNESPDDSR